MIERRWEHQLGPLRHPKKKYIWTNGKPSSEFKMILTFCYVVRPSIKVLRWSHGEARGRKSSISDSRGIKSAYTQLPAYPGSSVWWFAFVWPQRGFWAAESPQIKKKIKKKAERLGNASEVRQKAINICTNKEKESENMHRQLSRASWIFFFLTFHPRHEKAPTRMRQTHKHTRSLAGSTHPSSLRHAVDKR